MLALGTTGKLGLWGKEDSIEEDAVRDAELYLFGVKNGLASKHPVVAPCITVPFKDRKGQAL